MARHAPSCIQHKCRFRVALNEWAVIEFKNDDSVYRGASGDVWECIIGGERIVIGFGEYSYPPDMRHLDYDLNTGRGHVEVTGRDD